MAQQTADVVIVGAGIVGVCCAEALARAGLGRVLVLERAELAAGATRRVLGIIAPPPDDPIMARLMLESLTSYVTEWPDRVGSEETGFTPAGCLHLLGEIGGEGAAAAARLLSLGMVTGVADAPSMRRVWPGLVVGDGEEGLHHPAGYADGYAITLAGWRAAQRAGATLREGTPVHALAVDHGRVIGVETSIGRIDAGLVLLAAGIGAPRLLAPLGLRLPLSTWRAQTLLVRHSAGGEQHSALVDEVGGAAWRPAGEGVGLLGNRRWPIEPAPAGRPRAAADPDFIAAALAALTARLPELAAEPLRGQASLHDGTPDGRPLLGPASGLEGLWLALGFGGEGPTCAPAAAAALVQGIAGDLGGPVLSACRPDRFGA